MKKRNDCAILVLSCDAYLDLWKPFFSQFYAYWPQCPYIVYLGSNRIKPSIASVISVRSEKNIDWSSNVLSMLDKVREKYIFIWLDDFFLTSTIKTGLFDQGFTFMKSQKAKHIHMGPDIPPDGVCEDPLFGYYQKGAPYRVAVAGFWNKHALRKLLLRGETPWKFEIFGSYRSSYEDGFYTMLAPLFEYVQIVERGRIFREAYEYCKTHNIQLSVSGWRISSIYSKIKSDIIRFIFNQLIRIPWKFRLVMMENLRKIFVSY